MNRPYRKLLTSGELAQLAGVRRSTIAWYEKNGLLPSSQKDKYKHNLYPRELALTGVQRVKTLQNRGFRIAEIKEKLKKYLK